MSVPLYTTCSAEQWGIQIKKKGNKIIVVIMNSSNVVLRPLRDQS